MKQTRILVSNRLNKTHDFEPGDFNVREFLKTEKQVLQVQMVDKDEGEETEKSKL